MDKSLQVVLLGIPALDIVAHFSEFPGPDEHRPLHELHTIPGGPACNIATLLARLGAEVTLLGKVGQDIFGDEIISALEAEGINLPDFRADGIKTTTVLELIEKDKDGGEKSKRSFSHFAAAELSAKAITDLSQKPIDILFLDGIVALGERAFKEAIKAADKILAEQDPLVACDPNLRVGDELPAWMRERINELLKYCQFIVLNKREASLLTGVENYQKAANELFSANPNLQLLAITLGAQGAFLQRKHENKTYKRLKVPAREVAVADSSGAGDTFTASLLFDWLQKLDLKKAAQLATSRAAQVVKRPGAWSALPKDFS